MYNLNKCNGKFTAAGSYASALRKVTREKHAESVNIEEEIDVEGVNTAERKGEGVEGEGNVNVSGEVFRIKNKTSADQKIKQNKNAYLYRYITYRDCATNPCRSGRSQPPARYHPSADIYRA